MSELCRWLHETLQNRPILRFPFEVTELPMNGIYFFYEEGENWGHSERQARIVRIGTHRDGNFRSRLADHFLLDERRMALHANRPAPKDRSIFRKHIGRALLARTGDPYLQVWDIDFTTKGNRQTHGNRRNIDKERDIEEQVSIFLREKFSFRFLQLDVAVSRVGSKGLESALIGTVAGCQLCKPSSLWLGLYSTNPKIRKGGLWLVQHLRSRPIDVDDKSVIEAALERRA